MALQKQNLSVNFSQGIDTKTDPFQLQPGQFYNLQNTIFDTAGRLTKRNGYKSLTVLPDTKTNYLTSFNTNLIALGDKLRAYSRSTSTWVDKGSLQPVKVEVLSVLKTSLNQIQVDSVTATNGLTCTAYAELTSAGTNVYKYCITDAVSGQNIVEPTLIADADITYGYPKTFILGNYFIIVYTADDSGPVLKYIAITITNPLQVFGPTDITSNYTPSVFSAFDGYVANNNLYLAWNGNDLGDAVRIAFLTSTLQLSAEVDYAGYAAKIISVTADVSSPTPVVYVSFYDNVPGPSAYIFSVDANLAAILSPTSIPISPDLMRAITSSATNGLVNITYTWEDSGIPFNKVNNVSVTAAGSVGSTTSLALDITLASKAFIIEDQTYVLCQLQSIYQPTYFLMNIEGEVIAKLAYSNASSTTMVTGLPSATIFDNQVKIAYLFKDLISPVNKSLNAPAIDGIYSQLGIGTVTFTIGNIDITSAEIGSELNISGGFMWGYDGTMPVENGFFYWPEAGPAGIFNTGGFMSQQQYFYQVTYEWTDNQGNIFRSAPSIPIDANVTVGSGNASVRITVKNLKLTYKISNPVNIVIYRWSAAQPVFYQVTSITQPVINDPDVQFTNYDDTLADASILGNNILYTTGGVLENIQAPATDLIALFNNRLWLVDSENRNLLWFSKQVVQNVPVEMTDLLTLYVAPTTSSEGSTGPITAISPMDDKLIIYKENALGYINGQGPDITGANNQYSDFTLINSVVGCTNQQSIVLIPGGQMFQSNKGIWLLGRDLNTQYIGAPVQTYTTGALVVSATNIPGTNQVRFNMDSGITLMYDYYFNQWSTFTKVPAVSAIVYENLHTYVNAFGRVFQETPGIYLDNTSPVLINFTTSWFNLAGLQGFERFYQLYLLGQYKSPFKLNVQLAYDYNSSIEQQVMVTPETPSGEWGDLSLWGSGSGWGGPSEVFEARVFPQIQKCESFQITITEIYDPRYGIAAGEGLTLSGLNLVVGLKKGYRTSSSNRSFG